MSFSFEAMTSAGDVVTDTIEAADEPDARDELSKRGLFVMSLKPITTDSTQARNVESLARRSMRRTPLTPELQQRHRREKRTVGIGFVIMGLLVFVFGAWMAWDAIVFLASADSAVGICVGQSYNQSDNNYNIPIIEFKVDGQKHRVESRGILGMQFIGGHTYLQSVTVMYPTGHPEDARVGGVLGNLQFPLAFLGFGSLFIVSGFWLIKATRKAADDARNSESYP